MYDPKKLNITSNQLNDKPRENQVYENIEDYYEFMWA
jgi:hypothetical protein